LLGFDVSTEMISARFGIRSDATETHLLSQSSAALATIADPLVSSTRAKKMLLFIAPETAHRDVLVAGGESGEELITMEPAQ
jgi:hypothetical protein